MIHLQITESSRDFIDRDLVYDDTTRFSDPTKAGLPVPKSDLLNLYFYINSTETSTTPLILLSDIDPNQIQWLDTVNGKIRIKPGSYTSGKSGSGYYCELKAKMPDGSYISLFKGIIDIHPTIVGTP